MRRFIHSSFELDLSTLGITDTSENPWFTGNFFAKYSYPFDIPLTDEYNKTFNFISHFNSSGVETLFEGVYVHGGNMEKAILEIEECETSLSCTLRYGFDEFPNFKKSLSQLPLQVWMVPDIYSHAATVVQQSWPDINYNFPQIHIDKIEPEDSDIWFAFEKIINNYKNGHFLQNTVEEGNTIYNRNIIQPLPYLLHVLTAGVQDAGYTLHGDILNDHEIVRTLLYSDKEYYKSLVQDPTTLQIMAADALPDEIFPSNNGGNPFLDLIRKFPLPGAGIYRVSGSGRLRRWVQGWQVGIKIFYRTTILYQRLYSFSSGYDVFPYVDFTFDITFSTATDMNPHEIRVEVEMGYNEPDIVIQGEIILISNFGAGGTPLPTIYNENKVDLTKAVPEMLFGDLIKAVLAMKNMDIDIRGTEVWINFIQKEYSTRPIVNLSELEVKFPKRKFSKGNSYLLKYQEVEYEHFKYVSVFQNVDGLSVSDFVTDEKTTEISINALPLPLLNRAGINTAHGFAQDKAKPFFVLYDGLTGGLNLAKDPSNLLIPYLHAQHHNEWFAAMISSINFSWTFYAFTEQMLGLSSKSRIFAYNNVHLVKIVQRKEVEPDLFEVELETKLIT